MIVKSRRLGSGRHKDSIADGAKLVQGADPKRTTMFF